MSMGSLYKATGNKMPTSSISFLSTGCMLLLRDTPTAWMKIVHASSTKLSMENFGAPSPVTTAAMLLALKTPSWTSVLMCRRGRRSTHWVGRILRLRQHCTAVWKDLLLQRGYRQECTTAVNVAGQVKKRLSSWGSRSCQRFCVCSWRFVDFCYSGDLGGFNWHKKPALWTFRGCFGETWGQGELPAIHQHASLHDQAKLAKGAQVKIHVWPVHRCYPQGPTRHGTLLRILSTRRTGRISPIAYMYLVSVT